MPDKTPAAPRCAALIGPYSSGKTTLFESLLAATGAIARKGSVREGNSVGDSSPEARARQMGTELNVATTEYLGDPWTFLDCPGNVELAQETYDALAVADAAVLVCEPNAERAVAVAPILKFLDDQKIPHLMFINKMDASEANPRAAVEAFQAVSERPLVLREIPIRNGERTVGLVDLVSERAFRWNPGKASELIPLPDSVKDEEKAARSEFLETIADFDDAILEKLLEEGTPSPGEIYASLTRDLKDDLIVPVFFGSALNDNGVRRLLKALRHETPGPQGAARRFAAAGGADEPTAYVFKTHHAPHSGKLSFVRVLKGEIADGMTLGGERVGGILKPFGAKGDKLAKAGPGAVVALGRLEHVRTASVLTPNAAKPAAVAPRLGSLYALAIRTEQRADEVKLSGALARLVEEDPSLHFENSPETGEFLLWGQGDVHLHVAIDRLAKRYNLAVKADRPRVPYKETIRKGVSQHARHKKQSGGHGQFADVHVDIKPLPRGAGFAFDDTISGGVVPKQYIPAVDAGVREYMVRGSLGFPVVDIAVTLTDGQFHTVDSSEMAFKLAAQLAMREGMPKCGPVLLEPVHRVTISVPSQFTSRIQRLISGRRGHILGFDAKAGWKHWDEVSAQIPQAEMHDLINELRSITQGVGTFESAFDHLQELAGKDADAIVSKRAQAMAS